MNRFLRYIIFSSLSSKIKLYRMLIATIKASILVQFFPLKFYFKKFSADSAINPEYLQPLKADFRYFRMVFSFMPWNITCLIRNVAYQIYSNKYNLPFPIYLGIFKGKDNLFYAHAWNQLDQSRNENLEKINVSENG